MQHRHKLIVTGATVALVATLTASALWESARQQLEEAFSSLSSNTHSLLSEPALAFGQWLHPGPSYDLTRNPDGSLLLYFDLFGRHSIEEAVDSGLFAEGLYAYFDPHRDIGGQKALMVFINASGELAFPSPHGPYRESPYFTLSATGNPNRPLTVTPPWIEGNEAMNALLAALSLRMNDSIAQNLGLPSQQAGMSISG